MRATSDHLTLIEDCLFCTYLRGQCWDLQFSWIHFTDTFFHFKQINRGDKSKKAKTFHFWIHPSLLPTHMYKCAPFLILLQSRLLPRKSFQQTNWLHGFLVPGECGEGRGREKNHFPKRKSTKAMPFWWFTIGLSKILQEDMYLLKVTCYCYFWK